MEKCLEYMLIAAHLMKTDVEEWKRVGDIHLEQDNLPQAIACYERATRLNPGNMQNCEFLCGLLKRTGDERRILDSYGRMLAALPLEDVSEFMRVTRDVVKGWHQLDEKTKALAVMSEAFRIHPTEVEATDINTLIELYISFSNYNEPLEILVQHCSVQLHYHSPTSTVDASSLSPLAPPNPKPIGCTVPDEMPVDLRSKLIVCLIHLGYYECIETVIAPMRRVEENIEIVGDLFVDIADAYVSCGLYAPAKPILASLIVTKTFNMAAVWLRYAECLNALQELRNAAEAYVTVVSLAPNHYQARLSLSAIYQQLGQSEEALKALTVRLINLLPIFTIFYSMF